MLTTPQGEFITARSHPMLTQVRVTMIPGALLLQAPGMPLRAAISAVYTSRRPRRCGVMILPPGMAM